HGPRDPRHHPAGQGRAERGGEALRLALAKRRRLPKRVDLRQWAGPVYFQGGFNTCNAHVVAGLLTYFETRAFDRCEPPSRLFLYKVAKNFLQTADDTGVYIRQVMGV